MFPSVEDHPATPVIRLIRRICLLREQGDAAASALERDQLAAAVQAARAKLGADALPESELRQIFARESERAAEALAIAELIVQQLAPGSSGVARGADLRAPRPREPRAPAPSEPPAIADLLDAMLASESQARSR